MDNIDRIAIIFYSVNVISDTAITVFSQFFSSCIISIGNFVLAAGIDPITGEVFPANSPYNQPEIIRALFFAINELEALAEKGNQGLAWSEEEDELLAQRFRNGSKITELTKLHSRTYGAIKARLIKLGLLQK